MLLDGSLANWLRSNIRSISALLQFVCVWMKDRKTDCLCQKEKKTNIPHFYAYLMKTWWERNTFNTHLNCFMWQRVLICVCVDVSPVVKATRRKSNKADDEKKEKKDGMTPLSFPPLSQVCSSCQHITPSICLTHWPLSSLLLQYITHTHTLISFTFSLRTTTEPQFAICYIC